MSTAYTEEEWAELWARVAAVDFDYEAQPKELVQCNLCGGIEWRVVCTRSRCEYPISVVECTRCKLLFLNPRMTASAYTRFYETGIYRQLTAALDCRQQTKDQILHYPKDIVRHLGTVFDVRRGGSLLDIGGDDGVVTRYFAEQYNLDPTIVDPAAGTGLVEEWPAWRQYDVVMILRTVDHLLDPLAVLERAWSAVKPGGVLLLDFVDWNYIVRDRPLNRTFKVDHPYYFTRKTMAMALRACRIPITKSSTLERVVGVLAEKPHGGDSAATGGGIAGYGDHDNTT